MLLGMRSMLNGGLKMTADEKEKLSKYIIAASEIYGKQLSEEAIALYIAMLKDYSFADIKKAIQVCLTTKESFPVPAAIINQLTKDTGGDIETRAELAWGYTLNVIDVCGVYESFTFKDKAIRKTLSLMDYAVDLCLCDRSEMHWKKRDFTQSYKVFAGLNSNNYDAQNYFAGVIELNNGDSWSDTVQTKVYIAEDRVFVRLEELNKLIEGYKPELKLIKNIKKLIEK